MILDSSCPKSIDFMNAVEAKVTAEITIKTARSRKPRRGLFRWVLMLWFDGFMVFIILKNSFHSKKFRRRLH